MCLPVNGDLALLSVASWCVRFSAGAQLENGAVSSSIFNALIHADNRSRLITEDYHGIGDARRMPKMSSRRCCVSYG